MPLAVVEHEPPSMQLVTSLQPGKSRMMSSVSGAVPNPPALNAVTTSWSGKPANFIASCIAARLRYHPLALGSVGSGGIANA